MSLHSADLDRTYRFYAAIGVELRWHTMPSGHKRLLIDAGEVTLEFRHGDRYGKEPWATIGFLVDSVYDTFVRLQGVGHNPFGTVGECPYYQMMYTDPDGHVVYVTLREPDAPADGGGM
jgi:predicted lactoylglutathione lyase